MKKQTLSDLFRKNNNNIFFNIHTIQPGKFITYYGHTQKKAKVQPLVKMKDNKNNNYQINPIDNVPVIFPCVSNFELKYPINKNDGCLLLFAENRIGNYLNSPGGLKSIVEADDSNKFELTDCIAIPGLYSFANVPTPDNKIEIDENNNFIIQTILGSIKIDSSGSILQETTSGKVEVDSTGNIIFNNGTESYVLGNSFETAMTTVINLIISHVHDIVGVQAGVGTITSSVSTSLASLVNPVTGNLSTKIKGA